MLAGVFILTRVRDRLRGFPEKSRYTLYPEQWKVQRVFDELWTHVTHHMMAYTQANHLLPFEVFLLMMLLEEHKEVRRIRNILAEFQFKR